MNNIPNIPDDETRNRSVTNMKQVCRQIDVLTLKLDEIIAILEADIREKTLARHLLNNEKIEQLPISEEQL